MFGDDYEESSKLFFDRPSLDRIVSVWNREHRFTPASESHRRICRVLSVSNVAKSRVIAPGHGLTRGDLVRLRGVRGLPDLEGQTFVVGDATPDSFELLSVSDVPIEAFDVKTGTVVTKSPHKSKYSVKIIGLEGCCELRADILEVANPTTLTLAGDYIPTGVGHQRQKGPWDPSRHGLRDSGKIGGSALLGDVTHVDLSEASAPGEGGVILRAPWLAGPGAVAKDWRDTFRIIGANTLYLNCDIGKRQRNVQVPTVDAEAVLDPGYPLSVMFCGSTGHQGTYIPSQPDADETAVGLDVVYARGAARIAFSADLGAWCLISDMWPNDVHLYKLKHSRRAAGTTPWLSGPQLLYVCTSPSPTGKWVAALGEEPAPQVRLATERSIPRALVGRLSPHPCACNLFSWPWQGGSPLVFQMLLDFESVDWRGFCGYRAPEGITAAEIGMRLVGLVRDSARTRAVCRAFMAAVDTCVAKWSCAVQRLLQVGRGNLLSAPKIPPQVPSGQNEICRSSAKFSEEPAPKCFLGISEEVLLHIGSMLDSAELAAFEPASRLHASVPGAARREEVAVAKAHLSIKSLVSIFSHTRSSWYSPFAVTSKDAFKSRTWGCSVSDVQVSTSIDGSSSWDSEEVAALRKVFPAFIDFARELLCDVPVCWNRKATVNGETTTSENEIVTKTVYRGSLTSTPPPLRARAQLQLVDGHLTTFGHERLFDRHSKATSKLREGVARLGGGADAVLIETSKGFSSTSRRAGQRNCDFHHMMGEEPCPDCAECQETRGWSELHATLSFLFDISRIPLTAPHATRKDLLTEIRIKAFVVPFFCTSEDSRLVFPGDQVVPSDVSNISEDDADELGDAELENGEENEPDSDMEDE